MSTFFLFACADVNEFGETADTQTDLTGVTEGVGFFHSNLTNPLNDGKEINNDENITYFPSYGYFNAAQQKWNLTIHGWIYEPEANSAARNFLLGLLKTVVGFAFDSTNVVPRIKPLMADNESDEEVSITLGGKSYAMAKSDGAGHFYGTVTLSDAEVQAIKGSDGWISFTSKSLDNRIFTGRVQVIPPTGTSLVSDIDDTIKVTEIPAGVKKVVENTFIKDPKATPGLVALYKDWQQSKGVSAFHYVSGSPWQLHNSFLADFRKNAPFPEGTFHMKDFRVNPFSSELFNAIASGATFDQKIRQITGLCDSYPTRNFILVGDSGEKDPEVYSEINKKYGSRILEVYIRNVTNETYDNTRIKTLFGDALSKFNFLDPNTGAVQPKSAAVAGNIKGIIGRTVDSPHNYPDNYNQTFTITQAGATSIKVSFSKIDVEKRYDYVNILDKNNVKVASYTGLYTNLWTNAVTGDTVKIQLISDRANNAYGFTVDKIDVQ